jgi:hypothetical protein
MSSSSEHGSQKPSKTTTIEIGSAVWSSVNTPPSGDDPYKSAKSLRDNYKNIGDAYDRNQDVATEWETNDPYVEGHTLIARFETYFTQGYAILGAHQIVDTNVEDT